MKVDFHIHTSHSRDSLIKPETLLKIARQKGLSVAVTDHNTTSGWAAVKKLAKGYCVDVVYGEEIKTTHNGNRAGELLGLFMQEPVKSTEYLEVIDELKAQDAWLAVPHPFDHLRMNFKHLNKVLKKVDCIEVFNSRCWRAKFNNQAKEFAEKKGIPGIAGSDSHTPEELGNAYVEVEAQNLEEARKKILKGKVSIFGKRAKLSDHFKTQMALYKIMKDR